ncbi:hypothetical protein KF840_01240 [bacterium]|nr:hypothetical protein [bacterium]
MDLMANCELLARQAERGEVVFGINHEMRDFKQNRRKNLDLVICTPGRPTPGQRPRALLDLVPQYRIELSDEDRNALRDLPPMYEGPVGVVQCALEAKACMTEHMKARPRLFDELNSSHQTIHGSGEILIAVGFVMVNIAREFVSPMRGGALSSHRQPDVTSSVIRKLEELPRRSGVGQDGFDALAITVVDCRNDGKTPVRLAEERPAPAPGEIFHYDSMIHRLVQLYEARFPRA